MNDDTSTCGGRNRQRLLRFQYRRTYVIVVAASVCFQDPHCSAAWHSEWIDCQRRVTPVFLQTASSARTEKRQSKSSPLVMRQEDEENDSDKNPSKGDTQRSDDDPLNELDGGEAKRLLGLLLPDSKCDADQTSPTALAYIGDVVYELFVRSRYVWPPRKTSDLQSSVVNVVRAETQSRLIREMLTEFPLTPKEKSLLTRGRNAASGSGGRKRGPRRLYSKESGPLSVQQDKNTTDNNEIVLGRQSSSGPSVYQDATAFEALIGYSFIQNTSRCEEILKWIQNKLGDELL